MSTSWGCKPARARDRTLPLARLCPVHATNTPPASHAASGRARPDPDRRSRGSWPRRAPPSLIVVILRAVGWHSRIPSHPVRYSVTVWMHMSGVHVVRPYVSHEMVVTPLCSPAAGMRHMYETEPPRVRAQAHPSVVQENAVWGHRGVSFIPVAGLPLPSSHGLTRAAALPHANARFCGENGMRRRSRVIPHT